jgi:Nucleotidyl transferase AbiEii toxin, Type IV TA system
MKDRAKSIAKRDGVNIGDVLTRFYFQRFLARIFVDGPDGWLLKGGQALLVRYSSQARASRDVDLYRQEAVEIEDAIAALRRAAERDLCMTTSPFRSAQFRYSAARQPVQE